jgi:hypothetical protein
MRDKLTTPDVRRPFWLSENGKSVTTKGADVDTLVASANAYLGALKKLMVKRQRGKPEAMMVPWRTYPRDVPLVLTPHRTALRDRRALIAPLN